VTVFWELVQSLRPVNVFIMANPLAPTVNLSLVVGNNAQYCRTVEAVYFVWYNICAEVIIGDLCRPKLRHVSS